MFFKPVRIDVPEVLIIKGLKFIQKKLLLYQQKLNMTFKQFLLLKM